MLKKILPLALWLTATVTALGQNAVMVDRTNSVITYPLNFWTANALVGRSGLGFNTNLNTFWAATNAGTARTAIGALATNGNGSAVTNLTAANITGTVAISNGGSGATTAGGAVTNFFTPNTPLVFATNGQVVANTGTNVLTFTSVHGVQVDTLRVGDSNLHAVFYKEDDTDFLCDDLYCLTGFSSE